MLEKAERPTRLREDDIVNGDVGFRYFVAVLVDIESSLSRFNQPKLFSPVDSKPGPPTCIFENAKSPCLKLWSVARLADGHVRDELPSSGV